MRPPADIRRNLIETGRLSDDAVPLAATALLLGAIERPSIRLGPYQRHLDDLAVEVGNYLAGAPADPAVIERHEALQQIIARRYGYAGTEDVFGEPEGANLTRVIDRRTGLPVALGVIYLDVAAAQGWRVFGLDFPGRFLIRLEADGDRLVVDPFVGGAVLGVPEMRALLKAYTGNHAELTAGHYREMTAREVLLRLVGNIKERHLREDRLEDAAGTCETALLFAPQESRLWRECGLLHARLDDLPRAVVALEEFLKLSRSGAARYKASLLLQELRQRLN